MKRFFMSIVLLTALSMALPLICSAEGDRTVTILYSGNIWGNITPVKG
ncbi:MAG: hypothetical protein GY795_28465 [Desulfobacterales bacterium]|nr:hypothetical protein [Desulfobacterales bacterium]